EPTRRAHLPGIRRERRAADPQRRRDRNPATTLGCLPAEYWDINFAWVCLSFPPGGGRGAVKLAPLRRRSRGERGHVKLCPLRRCSRGERGAVKLAPLRRRRRWEHRHDTHTLGAWLVLTV